MHTHLVKVRGALSLAQLGVQLAEAAHGQALAVAVALGVLVALHRVLQLTIDNGL